MTARNQRNQILESLESLDHLQAEKVLNYIKGLKNADKDPSHQRVIKREAMIQIRQALVKGRTINPGF
jgi:hypothetical protein